MGASRSAALPDPAGLVGWIYIDFCGTSRGRRLIANAGPGKSCSRMGNGMTTNTKRAVRPRRSFIFSPGVKPDMFPKALASGADVVCVELEDGIAPKDKGEARRNGLEIRY